MLILCLVLTALAKCDDDAAVAGTEIDYTGLAGEAETHKQDILTFLNQTKIQHQYKALYDSLLSALLNDTQSTRRGSTRRIVSGRNTTISAVPWQVSLREKTYPICGASVITDLWLLTAAHCLLRNTILLEITVRRRYCPRWIVLNGKSVSPYEENVWRTGYAMTLHYGDRLLFIQLARASELSVRLGSSWKTHGGEMYDIKDCFVHPRYVSKTKVNDVGLVSLYSPLRFSARVLPIRLVAREETLLADLPAIVSGWGKLKEGGPSASYLQSSTIKTIAMKLCRWSGLDRKAIEPASMFCAGSFSQSSPDACQGDSGGPIVHEGVLIGVVSWGLGCARGNFPGVYTRLAFPVIWDWVHSHISRKITSNNTL